MKKRKRIHKVSSVEINGLIIIDDPIFSTSKNQKEKARKNFNFWIRKRINSMSPNIPIITLHSRIYEKDIYSLKNNENMRTSPPKKTSLRLELEEYVYSCNTILKDAVKTMDIIILLRNAHPSFRSSFASLCFEKGLISEFEKSEFIIRPILRIHSRTN